jgi:hypothetical protein
MSANRYFELQDETIEFFNDVVQNLAFPMRINFKVIGDSKQKALIVVKKVSPVYEFVTESQILVTINEDLYDLMSGDDATELLFREAINNIELNVESGAVKVVKPNLYTSTGIVERYGLEAVKRAKDLEKETLEQSEERKTEEVDFS